MANIYTFYIHINSDTVEDGMEIKTGSDLAIGDLFDSTDHDLEEQVRNEFNTTLFIITKRKFNLKFREMHLELIPY